ncbi:HD domain-containing phosphohydrolase [Anaerotruncus rubiinfantis]|uniref:HD domain-containing phosphohydrolase n=3 Tax=Anaerotruncus rubiinfantis TaxID=1720200 RepID=UPI001FAB5A19|nr:HD domain-containing phosphohydrolase [Anaerotruncus rubiinfantis]
MIFVAVPLTALSCYLFLLLAFLAAKKNKVIYSFIALLIIFIMWTGGSFFMRMQLYPGVPFWCQVSNLGMFCIPLFYYNFMCDFLGYKGYFLRGAWTAGTAIILIMSLCDVFITNPQVLDIGDGQASFIYDMSPLVAIPVFFCMAVVLSIILMVVKDIKKNGTASTRITPVLIGLAILFFGNIAASFPFIGRFPGDTLSGIINAGFMFYALYKRRLFKLTLLVSRGTTYLLAAIFSSLLFINMVRPLEDFIRRFFPQFSDSTTLVIAIVFAVLTFTMYKLMKTLLDNLFIKEEAARTQQLRDFSTNISKSLNLDDILDQLVTVVKSAVDVEKVYVCLADDKTQFYRTMASASPLDSHSFAISFTNPCVRWMREQENCLILKEFSRTVPYKSMWESEKRQLRDLDIECLVPLVCDEELVGILCLAKKYKHDNYTFDDVTFLESVNSIVSIAIKNAKLYEKAYYESRIDNLTGLLNRKFFYEKLDEEFERCRDRSLALVILNVDDFKLYNQLYGNMEGDLALQSIARIITACVGQNGIPARYGGKEFAIILPCYDAMAAYNLACTIKQQIIDMNKHAKGAALRALTLSGGICAYPYAASNVKQLVGNADMAVFNAKRSGKNKIIIYSLQKKGELIDVKDSSVATGVYAEYASTIYALTAAIDAKDHYTFSHSQNVAEYSTALAVALNLNKDHIEIIREAALLHDIGKIGIPEEILNKPGRLTREEFETMKTHVEHSIAMIRHLPSLDYVIPAVIGHHERWDGKGYPRGISGEDIPIAARCLAIADSFDAMTSKRSYKQALPVDFAIKEIEDQAGRQFDPRLAKVFVEEVRAGRIQVHPYVTENS